MGTASNTDSSPTRAVRVWPPASTRLFWLLLIILGPIGIVAGLIFGVWPLAIIAAILPLVAIRLIGWVEVHEDRFVDRRLIGESQTVLFDSVREVGIGMHQNRKSKKWYPEISTLDGNSVKFRSLMSASGKTTIDRVDQMYQACKARLPVTPEEVPVEAVSVGKDGELEFAIAPSYENYLRERAKEEANPNVSLAPLPERQPPPVPEESTEPAPRLLVAVESPPDIGEIDEEPDVFEPAPLTPKREKRYLVAVPDTEVIQPTPAPPPTVIEKPKTVIEKPKTVIEAAKPADGSDRSFTSLFRRDG